MYCSHRDVCIGAGATPDLPNTVSNMIDAFNDRATFFPGD